MQQQETARGDGAAIAMGFGCAALVAAFLMYWFPVPAVVLAVVAIVMGVRARRRGARELAAIAITVAVIAIAFGPALLSASNSGEDWGRDCALDPTSDPNC